MLQIEVKICAGSYDLRPKICPINLSWTTWTPWTNCSSDCGPSFQQRTRSCINGRYGGPKCPQSFQGQKKNCPTKDCPVDCKMGDWQEWSSCSSECVNILQNGSYVFPKKERTRQIVQKSNTHGQSCDDFQSTEVQPCNMNPCPINGQWREWSQFSACSVSCGNGTQTRKIELMP